MYKATRLANGPMRGSRLHFAIAMAISIVFLLFVLRPFSVFKMFKDDTPDYYKENMTPPPVPPPTYERLREWEAKLPQHDLSLPSPEGRTGRYVRFSNQIAMLGWNNVFCWGICPDNRLMNAHLAYESNRSYVFQDYVWKPEYYPWPELRRQWAPPRTPLNALLGGTVVGGPFDKGDNAPRSISDRWFDIVCPRHERRVIGTSDVKPAVAWKPGNEVFDHWAKLLRDAPERCIEIKPTGDDNFPQTFDLWLWGCDRILSMWDRFSKSPTSRLLTTSPIVAAAVKRNEYLFLPRGPRPSVPVSVNPYERMMAMHIRRGDFKAACHSLAYWNSTFYSWNLLPSLPDPFKMPEYIVWNSSEYRRVHMERCLPEPDKIIQKARIAREQYVAAKPEQHRVLDIMYLLTNEKGAWLESMKNELRKDGWNTIITTNDLELDSEGYDVGMAIDMDIARQAAVFIGNGWSSFTSNIVHRRLVDGKDPISIRFW